MLQVWQVFKYFLKLGATGFGGPVALVGMMQKDLIDENHWVDSDKFKKVLPLLKAMPGAFSFQTAVYLGQEKAGRWGGFFAGLGLILPASIMMVLLGVFLNRYGESPEVKYWIQGFQWGAILLMLNAALNLVNTYLNEVKFWIYIVISFILASFFHFNEFALILTIGMLSLLVELKKTERGFLSVNVMGSSFLGSIFIIDQVPSLKNLFLICFSSGAFVFGTGIAIAPMLEKYFVNQFHWISHGDFISALSLSQMTPGPVLVIVTLIGYKVLGIQGAVLATLGVYLSGWIHMLTWFPKVTNKLIQMKTIQNFLRLRRIKA